MLHGISLGHITSNANKKLRDVANASNSEIDRANYQEFSSCSCDSDQIDKVPACQNVGRKESCRDCCSVASIENKMRPLREGSQDRYDVIGELSINRNNVEETISRVWENDTKLHEVSYFCWHRMLFALHENF